MKVPAYIMLTFFGALLIAGCDTPPPKYQYIETPRGLISYNKGYCELGMLISKDGVNIRDENNAPITCKGYIYLTREQVKAINN